MSYISPNYPAALFTSTTLIATIDGIPDPQVVQYSTMLDASMVGVAEHVVLSPLATAYPNPAHGNGRVRFADSQSGPVELVLLDMLGRPVRTRSAVVTMPAQELDVDLDGLTVGLYSLRITTADGRVSTLPWMVE